jgi:tol-pal system protein YbgF
MSHAVARTETRNFASPKTATYDHFVVTTIRHMSVAFVVLAGCATPATALREDNHKLTQTVTDLRDDRREQDQKLRDLEHQIDQMRAQQVANTMATVPVLPVEVVGPGAQQYQPQGSSAQRIVGVADDGGEIVYEGDAAAGKVATIDDDPPAALPSVRARPRIALSVPVPTTAPSADMDVPTTTDRIEVLHHAAPVAARGSRAHLRTSIDRDTAPVATDAAATEYRAAVDLLKAGKVEDATAALRAFIAHYPKHDFADNAQYWLGEASYVQKDYAKALAEFRATIETYPRGNKVPDALLKVGYCYQALGQTDKARAVLEQVVNLYPKTEPAALAAKRLETP